MDRFFSVFRTTGNALSVQRRQVQIASENIANAQTTRTGRGTYRPKRLALSQPQNDGFRRTLINTEIKMRTTDVRHRPAPQAVRDFEGTVDLGPKADLVEQDKYRFEYDPMHPDADENGMVRYPDIDLIEEMTRLISANRLYEANLSALEAEKEIIKRSFEI
ncbi:MAG: flagellar basal body rod protein FlgC [Balneolaceae bacterium]